MQNVLNKIILKDFPHVLFDEKDVGTVMKILSNLELTCGFFWKGRVAIANCRWAKAPNCWFVKLHCSQNTRNEFMKMMKEAGVELLPEYIGY